MFREGRLPFKNNPRAGYKSGLKIVTPVDRARLDFEGFSRDCMVDKTNVT